MATATDPTSQTTTRFSDALGRPISVTNPLGQRTRLTYDTLNRLTQTTDPRGGTTQFSYDANGNLLSVTDARSNATTYVYDDMDRVTTRTDPLTRADSYTYDTNGNLASVTDRKSQTTSLTYDALDRLTQRTFQGGATITYTWDAGNRLTQLVDSVSGTITRTYDGLDRLLTEATPNGTVTYTYDAAGRRASMAVPGQATITYSYDNADRLTSITQSSAVATFEYDDANRRTRLTLPNGVKTEHAYDNASRLTGLTYKLGTNTLGNLAYSYDPVSQRTKVGGTWARTLIPTAVASTTYDSANQQTAFGGQTETYDLNGNLTGDGSNTYTWNSRNQLASIAGPTPGSFVYDPFGRRQRKTINGTVTDFVYDGLTPVREAVGATTIDLLAGQGIDEYLTRTTGSSSEYILSEASGSTVALADSSGAVATEHRYEPFGTATTSGSSSTNELRFTGREDDGTGLYYYRARYYHPGLQRFVSEDPLGLAAGPNTYGYADNNPVSNVDPLGLCTDPGGLGPRYCIDRFIPTATAMGFRGDYRSAAADGGSYRIRQLIRRGPYGGLTEDHDHGETVAEIPALPFARRGVPGPCGMDVRSLPLGGRKIVAYCSGWNGVLGPSLSPPIQYVITIVEDAAGNARVLRAVGTPYPSLEVWQYGASDPRLLLHVPATGTPLDLFRIVPFR